ncbi:MAG: hypothetical protein Q7R41_04620 [Phycisphaerales bacterium]|nr:hypothetical protein [Phycisphaerales bacterium]
MSDNKLRRRIVFDDTMPIDVPLAGIDADSIRRVFSDLFDRAAQAVSRAGYDQDDAVVERFIVCRTADTFNHEIPADYLSDAGRLTEHVTSAVRAAGAGELDPAEIRIIGLQAVATLESLE